MYVFMDLLLTYCGKRAFLPKMVRESEIPDEGFLIYSCAASRIRFFDLEGGLSFLYFLYDLYNDLPTLYALFAVLIADDIAPDLFRFIIIYQYAEGI